MPFTALIDGQRAWSFDFDAAAWRELRDGQASGQVAVSLECCRENAVLDRRGDVPFFQHESGSDCATVRALRDQGDLLGSAETPAPDELAALIAWAVGKAGWPEPAAPGASPKVFVCADRGREARIVLLTQRLDPEHKRLRPLVEATVAGEPLLWVVTRNVPLPAAVPGGLVLRLASERAVVDQAAMAAVRGAVAGFLDAIPVPAPALPVPVAADPADAWFLADSAAPAAIRPEEHQFSYLHLPNRPSILTIKEREALWGVPIATPHPLAHLGRYSNEPYDDAADVTPSARKSRRA